MNEMDTNSTPSVIPIINFITKNVPFNASPIHGPGGVPTIGYESAYYPGGRTVEMTDQAITQASAEAILTQHVANVAHALWSYLKKAPTANQWTALVSLANDVGVEAVGPSLLIRYFNAGDSARAVDEFAKCDHVWRDGELIKVDAFPARREAERKLFLTA